MNVTLGCAKCRQSMYGCGTCRERAGICDPENPPVLALPCSSPEDVRVADSGAILGGSARRRGRAAAAAAASAAKTLSCFGFFAREEAADGQRLGGGVRERGGHLGRHHEG